MRRIIAAFAILTLGALATSGSYAARNIETVALSTASSYELLVLEVPGCLYCRVLRRDVLPAYEISPRAREVPIRFVDLNDIDDDRIGLTSPVDIVPTVVLMRDNKEVGRITGYLGPESFFHSVNHLMNQAE